MEFVHQAVGLIATHKTWAGLAIAALSFAESMVVLGLLVISLVRPKNRAAEIAAGAVTGIIVHPIVGRLVEAAGDAAVAEFRQRFGGA